MNLIPKTYTTKDYEALKAQAAQPHQSPRQHKISLTFEGGNSAYYQDTSTGEQKLFNVNSEAHWQKAIAKAIFNGKEKGLKVVIINPRRDSNPYEGGCPQDVYDFS